MNVTIDVVEKLKNRDLKKNPLTESEREALLDVIEAHSACPYKWYVPNGKAEEVIKSIGEMYESGKRIWSLSAANGFSKSTTILNIWANIIWKNESEYFQYGGYSKTWTWPKHVWLVSDDSAVKDVFDNPEVGFDRWWPANKFEKSYGDGRLQKVETDNGWVFTIKTVDQGLRKFESATIGGIWYDEPVTHRIHKACARGLRRGGIIINASTPLEQAEWQIDQWYENEEMNKYLQIFEACLWENVNGAKWVFPDDQGEIKDVVFYYGRVKSKDVDKIKEQGKEHLLHEAKRGFLSIEAAEVMISQWDEEDLHARLWGKHKELQGRVIKDFQDEYPFVVPFDDKYLGMQIYRVIDPHDRRFPAVGWYAVDPNGDYFTVYEWPNVDDFNGKLYFQLGDLDRDIEGICKKILDIEREMPNIVYSWMDPNFGSKPYANSGLTVQEEFEQYGVFVDIEVTDDLTLGHSKLRSLFKTDNLTKSPKMKVCDNCMNHIWALKRYRYADDRKKKSGDSQHRSEKVSDYAKDFVDVMRYFAINDVKFSHKGEKLSGWRGRIANNKRGLWKKTA